MSGGPSRDNLAGVAGLRAALAASLAERDRLAAELRDSREMLHVAQRFAGVGVWDWDIANDHVTWSEEYCELYGLDPASAHPSREAWLATVHPDDRARADATLSACVARREPDFHVEYRILHPRHGERWLAGRGRLVCDAAGAPIRLVGVNLDITGRKRVELAVVAANDDVRRELADEAKAREAAQARMFQMQKLEALGQLTGGVAHDFNNLLSVVMSGAALLRKDVDGARRVRLADAIEAAARRGADLTRRLLTFARRQALRPAPLDLAVWLEEVRGLLARSLRGDITVEIAAAPGLWPVLADAGELELAVLNLAVNARDAMPKGGVLRLLAANAELDPLTDPDGLGGDFVRLSVEDTGIGMAPDVLARVFEPFFSTKGLGRGTGLGLSQVYGFARQSGGGAHVASTPGRGTAVTLLLPRCDGAPEAQVVAPLPPAAEDRRALRVLLVEDDDDVAALTGEMLRHLGHAASRAAHGLSALAALRGGPVPDLVITDVIMPGGQDGLDLARAIAREWPALPVVLCSGYGGAPARVAEAGLPLLRKPFSLDELRQAIADARRG